MSTLYRHLLAAAIDATPNPEHFAECLLSALMEASEVEFPPEFESVRSLLSLEKKTTLHFKGKPAAVAGRIGERKAVWS